MYLGSFIKNRIIDSDDRNLLNNIVLAAIIKGASLVVSLFSTPMYIRYFDNNEVLGVWYTVLSVISWISICDLGLGNGLRNRLVEALAKKDNLLVKKYISSTYVAISFVMIPVMIIGVITIILSDINNLLNIPDDVLNPTTLKSVVIILFLGIAINFIFKIINSIIYAIQKSSYNNVIALISSILPLLFICVYKGDNVNQNILYLSYVHIFSLMLPVVVATVLVFKFSVLKECKPSLKYVDFNCGKSLFQFGLQFFFAQIFFLILMSTNELIISHFFGANLVVNYSIYYKLFTFLGSFFILALTPLWSKITLDYARKNYSKLRKTINVLYAFSVAVVIIEFLVIPFLQKILDIWLKENTFDVDYRIAFSFAFFGSVYILNTILTTVANGIGKLGLQIIFYGVGAILKVPVIMILKSFGLSWEITIVFNAFLLLSFDIAQLIWIEKNIKFIKGE